jgi:predicted MPP superfamily phosphohydrolase
MAATVPVAVKGFNIINKAYEYQVRRIRIQLPKLPQAFHGLKIGQISDIHSGSFDNKVAVRGGLDLLMQEKPDVIFFTGDLVNRQTDEVDEYIDVFNKVKAPLGVYSVLGNHDYGEYRSWPSVQAKQQDFQDMLTAHEELGWKLLRNENHILRDHGASLAILGVENWGIKRFSKYGKVEDAHTGTEEVPTKLLLSHDPSHWEAKVLNYPDIDVTFSGHTHGFQFGIEAGGFRWSPSQYLYNQWAGLYQKGPQYIYVNRGYGFVGIPGRIGINPEITIVELVKS